MFGFFKRLFGGTPAHVATAAPSKREFSDAEAMCRIRNLLSDRRYKFRTLGRLARAIGRDLEVTTVILSTMYDVRSSRDNMRRELPKRLYTFAD